MSDYDITVAGHICLDVIPELMAGTTAENFFCPGTLRTVGPATLSTGGVVSNTGLSLYQMGFRVQMAGKVGDDPLGSILLDILRRKEPSLSAGMIVSPGLNTSYTIVLNPPGIDRTFLHCPGVNDVFTADELNTQQIASGRILHFGYPPLMRGIYSDGGNALAEKFRQVAQQGLLTSLDMANPDPLGESGKVDWSAWLKNVLPVVDVFLPSYDEILLMTNRDRYYKLCENGVNPATNSSLKEIESVCYQLVNWGAKIVVMKLGDEGLFVHTAKDLSDLKSRSKWTSFDWASWQRLNIYSPCYDVPVVGTTGSGDATVAGFLAAMLKDLPAEMALDIGVATGACNVQSADAVSAIPHWDVIVQNSKTWSKKPRRLR